MYTYVKIYMYLFFFLKMETSQQQCTVGPLLKIRLCDCFTDGEGKMPLGTPKQVSAGRTMDEDG